MPRSVYWKLSDGLIGALIAGVIFIPLSFIFGWLDLTISAEHLITFTLFYWLPAIVLGVFCGLGGGELARRLWITRSWFGVVIGGLAAALIVMFWMERSYSQNVANFRAEWTQAMRGDPSQPIPKLTGEFQELTAQVNFEASLAVSPDGQILAIPGNKTIILWNIAKNQAAGPSLVAHTSTIYDLGFSGDGHWLVSGGHDQKVVVWSVSTSKPVFTLQGHHADIRSVALNIDGTLAVSADEDGQIILWDLTTGREAYKLVNSLESGLPSKRIRDLEFSPDGNRIAASNFDSGEITLFDVNRGEVVGHLVVPSSTNGYVGDLSFSPNGNLLASTAQYGPVVWNVNTYSPLSATYEIVTNSIVDLSPDSHWIVFMGEPTEYGEDNLEAVPYIFEAVSGRPVGYLPGYPAQVADAFFLNQNQVLVSYRNNNMAQIGIWTFSAP